MSGENFSRWPSRSATNSSTQALRSTSLKITSGATCIDPPNEFPAIAEQKTFVGGHARYLLRVEEGGFAMSPLLLGAVLGATGAFLLDPDLGRRRRALIRDKVTRGVTEGREFADAATQDLQQRARGLAASVRSLRTGRTPDETLVGRL